MFWLRQTDINKQVVRSSSLALDTKKSELIFDLCRHFDATHYVSGIHGKDYLNEESFKEHNISVEYQDFKHPVYPQLYGEFVANFAIVDAWFNVGNLVELFAGHPEHPASCLSAVIRGIRPKSWNEPKTRSRSGYSRESMVNHESFGIEKP